MAWYGEIMVEGFAYGVQESEVELFKDGQPTGETVRVKDLMVVDPTGGVPNLRIRFRAGEMFDEFVSKMGLAKLSIIGDNKLALPDSMGARRLIEH